MNKELLENNYIFLPKFISRKKAKRLADEFETYCEKNNLKGDSQAKNSKSMYNYISFLELLCEKTKKISKIIDEKVLPTYTYARVYHSGDDLKIHKDRHACEISLTVNLFQSKDWPIFIKTPKGETRSVSFEPGDAMIYLGCIADHWRDEINQDKVVQVFLHYVRSRGENSFAYFDKKRKDLNEKTGWDLPYGIIGNVNDRR